MLLDKDLQNSYNSVGKKIFDLDFLSKKSIQSSVELFTNESIQSKIPRPIEVDVYTLVSGLPFSQILVNSLLKIQEDIKKILKKNSLLLG